MSGEEKIISYQHTFGASYWGLGKFGFTSPGKLTFLGAVATAMAFSGGTPFGLLVGFIALNDIKRASSATKVKEPVDLCLLRGWRVSAIGEEIPAIEPSKEKDDNSIPVKAETVVDAPVKSAAPVVDKPVNPIVTPPPTDPKPKYERSPWGGDAPSPQEAQNYQPSVDEVAAMAKGKYQPEGIPEDRKTDFEREQDAEVERRVKERTNKSDKPTGIIQQLFTKEDGYYRSWLCMGMTGAGKGVSICYASIMARGVIPGVSIWAVDPKSDPKEFSRWSHIHKTGQSYHYNGKSPVFSADQKTLIKAGINRILEGFHNDQSEYKILIIDELPAILRSMGSSARDTLDYLNSIASMGRSNNEIVWIFSNAIGLRANKIGSGDANYYQKMYLATPRKIREISDYGQFKGPRIKADDPVFNETGRAAWASTLDEWEPIPTSYYKVVSELPVVQPPEGFGTGKFENSEGEVALANLAYELVDSLVAMDVPRAPLAELILATDYAYIVEDKKGTELKGIVASMADGLRKYPQVVSVRKVKDGFSVSAPRVEKTAPHSDELVLDMGFLDD